MRGWPRFVLVYQGEPRAQVEEYQKWFCNLSACHAQFQKQSTWLLCCPFNLKQVEDSKQQDETNSTTQGEGLARKGGDVNNAKTVQKEKEQILDM